MASSIGGDNLSVEKDIECLSHFNNQTAGYLAIRDKVEKLQVIGRIIRGV